MAAQSSEVSVECGAAAASNGVSRFIGGRAWFGTERYLQVYRVEHGRIQAEARRGVKYQADGASALRFTTYDLLAGVPARHKLPASRALASRRAQAVETGGIIRPLGITAGGRQFSVIEEACTT
jgi:hypothetical protein